MKMMKLPETQEEEMTLAAKEKRQPICIYCEHPIKELFQQQYADIQWEWDEKSKKFVQENSTTSEDADKPEHVCSQCGDECRAKDWNFIDYDLVDY